MLEIGRICVKIAGRDAGKKAVVVDVLDEPYVLIDGETRRRKCNVKHLEPLNETIDMSKNATHAEVLKALGLKERKKKAKKEKTARPRKVKITKKTEAKKEKK
jgi:large subunit ribosomal protein L14e